MLVRHDKTIAEELDGLETDFRRKTPVPLGVPVQAVVKGALKATERQTQRAIIKALRLWGFFPIHLVNEGRRSAIGQMQAVGDGLVAGAPDLCVVASAGRVAWLEVKGPDGRLSDAQRVVINKLHGMGHLVAVVRDVDGAQAALRQWGWIA